MRLKVFWVILIFTAISAVLDHHNSSRYWDNLDDDKKFGEVVGLLGPSTGEVELHTHEILSLIHI